MIAEVELLSQGREPSPRRLGGRARAALGAGLCVAMIAAGGLWWRESTRQAAAAADLERAALAFTPAAPPAQLVPRVEQVRISTTDQRAYVTSRGHVDLDLQLVNDGDLPLELLNARLPQPGVRADPGPGGLVSSPTVTLLAPGTPTAVTVHLVVLCPQGLAGQPADHLDLTLDDHSGDTRSASLDLRSLPGFWDRVRRSACAVPADPGGSFGGSPGGSPGRTGTGSPAVIVPLVVRAVPTSLRWQGGTTSG
jgi:hypothetical protein